MTDPKDQPTNDSEDASQTSFSEKTFKLAAALLWEQRFLAIPVVLTLWAFQVARMLSFEDLFFQSNLLGIEYFSMFLIGRALELGALWFISIRSIRSFQLASANSTVPKGKLGAFLIYGVVYALLIELPAMSQFLLLYAADSQAVGILIFLSTVLSIACLYLAYRHFFYFFSPAIGYGGMRSTLSFSREVYAQNKWITLRILAYGIALFALLSNGIYAFSPDGRHILVVALELISHGVIFVVVSYLSIATCIQSVSQKDWHDFSLDPYRESRIATLEFQAPTILKNLISYPKTIHLLFIGIIVLAVNQSRVQSIPPAAEIQIVSASIEEAKDSAEESEIAVQILAQDDRYDFRGFKPFHLRLAPNKESAESDIGHPQLVLDESGNALPRGARPLAKGSTELTLIFRSSRPASSLAEIQGLNLWYLQTLLAPVNLSSSADSGSPPPNSSVETIGATSSL